VAEELHPIARALLSGECDCEPRCTDRSIACTICGEPTTCEAFIWHATRLWNRREAEEAQRDNRALNFIKPSDMGIACPGECTARLFATKHAEVQREHAQTDAFYRMLLAGHYNQESLTWLRRHGYAARVAAYFAAEGTTGNE